MVSTQFDRKIKISRTNFGDVYGLKEFEHFLATIDVPVNPQGIFKNCTMSR